MQSVAQPLFLSLFFISCINVTNILAPEAPIGWPRAIAPPLTFTLFWSMPNSLITAMLWAANASLISNKSISCKYHFAFLIASLLFQACSQVDVVPNQTTHEDIVKDNMKPGQAKWTTIFDDNRSTSLRDMVLGDDAGSLAMTVDSLTFNVILDKLSFMPLASVDSASGIVITDWYTVEANELRIKINVRLLDSELTNNSVSVQMFTQKFDGTKWIDQGLDTEKAKQIKESILSEARSLKTAIDLS